MKICFVWIDNFRNLENLSLNLSSEIKFKFNEKENKLTISEKFPELSNFFGDSISDVTGIIGKNGSGKSNVLELLCKVLKESKTAISSDFIIVEQTDGIYTCHFSFATRGQPVVPNNVIAQAYSGVIDDLKVIFFSNVYDGRKNDFGSEISDISVNAQQRFRFPGSYSSDFLRQYRLVSSPIFDQLNIDLPEKIRLRNRLWRNFESSRMDSDSHELIQFVKKLMRSRIKELTLQKKLLPILRLGIFLDIYTALPMSVIQNGNDKSLTKRVFDYLQLAKSESTTTDEISRSLLEQLENFLPIEYNDPNAPPSLKRTHLSVKRRKHNFNKLLNFARDLDQLLSNVKYGYVVEGSRSQESEYFTFDYSDPIFKKFAIEFIESIDISLYFEMDWIGLSSGHKAYLNLFSSLYEELKRSRQKNIFICIDEGDLYLHPKWQVEFLSRLVSTIPQMYSGEVQLALTSHSPFLVSDLPNQSLVILDRSRSFAETDGTKLNIKTFGGNLYDLYSSPFFLENKRMSDFAYSRISGWISDIERNVSDKKAKEKFENFLELIGDDIVRFKMKKALKND